jgi:hypothetical protein
MKISEEFPSTYLKASDLQGREIKVNMSHVDREKLGQDTKPVIYFVGKQKGLVLNKTNAAVISDFYGDDTDQWTEQPIILFSIKTDFQGKLVDAIRVRIPRARDAAPVKSAPKKPDPISSGPDNDMDDEIPF